jgi:hypothetical protein
VAVTGGPAALPGAAFGLRLPRVARLAHRLAVVRVDGVASAGAGGCDVDDVVAFGGVADADGRVAELALVLVALEDCSSGGTPGVASALPVGVRQ